MDMPRTVKSPEGRFICYDTQCLSGVELPHWHYDADQGGHIVPATQAELRQPLEDMSEREMLCEMLTIMRSVEDTLAQFQSGGMSGIMRSMGSMFAGRK